MRLAVVDRARRDAGLAADLLRASVGPAPTPFKVTLCLTFRCNHRCAICGIWARDKGDEMTEGELDRLLASMPRLTWLDLTGGEITLRSDLEAVAASVARHLPRLALLHFPTNGMHPERALAAARAFVRPGGPRVILTVSIDGPPELHDRLRGVAGAWQRAIQTLQQLRDLAGVEVFAGMTLGPENLDAVDATVAALADRLPGFAHRDLHVNVQHHSPHYFANLAAPRPDPAAVAKAIARFARRKGPPLDPVRVIEAAYLWMLPGYFATGRSPVPCRAGEVSCYIGPDGTVYACTIDPRPVGRLADYAWDLGRLWQSQARRALAAEIAADRCVGCWTPCEAYPSLMTAAWRVGRRLVRGAPG